MVNIWDMEFVDMDGDMGDAGLPGANPPEGFFEGVLTRLTALEEKVIPTSINQLTGISMTGAAANDLLMFNGTNIVKYTPEGIEIYSFYGCTFDGGGSEIPDNQQFDIRPSVVGEITGYTLLADQVGSISIGAWKDSFANYPPTSDDLAFTMTMTSNDAVGVNLPDPVPIVANDTIRLNVNSATTIQRVTCQFSIKRTLLWGPGA